MNQIAETEEEVSQHVHAAMLCQQRSMYIFGTESKLLVIKALTTKSIQRV